MVVYYFHDVGDHTVDNNLDEVNVEDYGNIKKEEKVNKMESKEVIH